MDSNKSTVLIVTQCYLPGYKYGGPIRSIANLTHNLGSDFNFKIITTDRDINESNSYPNINVDQWNKLSTGENVFYLSPENTNSKNITSLINDTPHNVLYLNSFFSPKFTLSALIARRKNRLKSPKIVVCPRGEFSEGAFQIKKLKKSAFVQAAKISGLYKGVCWQATTNDEKQLIQKHMGTKNDLIIAPNLPAPLPPFVKLNRSQAGELKVVFLSRINRKKNLLSAIEWIKSIPQTNIQFDIYGESDDKDYESSCLDSIQGVSDNIKFKFCGPIKNEDVVPTLRQYDLFLFPTLGENFGHAIYEALSSGVPILISDQTPWNNLEESNAGWALPLSDTKLFIEKLKFVAQMKAEDKQAMSEGAYRYVSNWVKDQSFRDAYQKLFSKY